MAKEFGLKGVLSLDGSPWARTLRVANQQSRSFASKIGAAGLLVAGGLGLGVAAAAAFGVALTKGVKAAAGLEELDDQFVVLLGSAQAATDRVNELFDLTQGDFAMFDLKNLASASFILDRLTNKQLGTGNGLAMVGDIAAATNQPIQTLATSIGLLYSGLEQGSTVTRPLKQLQRLGVITPDVRKKLEDLNKAGVKGKEAWAVAESALSKFSGSMQAQSGEWNVIWKRFGKTLMAAFVDFAGPIMEELKPVVAMFTEGIRQIAPFLASAGKGIAARISTLVSGALDFAQIMAGAFSNTDAVVDLIAGGLKMGVQQMFDYMKIGVKWFVGAMSSGIDLLIEKLADLFSGESGIGNAFGKLMDFFGKELQAIGPLLGAAFVFAGSQLLVFLRDRFLDIAIVFGTLLEYAVEKVLDQLAKIPLLGAKLFPGGKSQASFENIFNQRKADAEGLQRDKFGDFTEQAKKNLEEAAKAFLESGSDLSKITISVRDRLTEWADNLSSGAFGEDGKKQFQDALSRIMASGKKYVDPFRAAAAMVALSGPGSPVATNKAADWNDQFRQRFNGAPTTWQTTSSLGAAHVQGTQGGLGIGSGQAYHQIRQGDAWLAAKAKADASKTKDKQDQLIGAVEELDDSINEPEWVDK